MPAYDERGLLSIAFHPNFSTNGKVYAYYSAPLRAGADPTWSCTNRLSEFTVNCQPGRGGQRDRADPARGRQAADEPQRRDPPLRADGQLPLPDPRRRRTCRRHRHGPHPRHRQRPGPDETPRQGHPDRRGHHERGQGSTASPRTTRSSRTRPSRPRSTPTASATRRSPPSTRAAATGCSSRWPARSSSSRSWSSTGAAPTPGTSARGRTASTRRTTARWPNTTCRITSYTGQPLIGPVVELGHDVGNTVVGGVVYRGSALSSLQGAYIFGTWSDELRPRATGRSWSPRRRPASTRRRCPTTRRT